MALQVGIREAKARLSSLVGRAKRGETVTITDRGRPVARLVPVEPEERTAEEQLRALESEGLVSAPRPWASLLPPLHLADESLAQRYLQEDRNGR
ncbi:MAG: type II toxin-antitoxin system Phd/YefM family antitoxin [Deferrisomatales bacterium]